MGARSHFYLRGLAFLGAAGLAFGSTYLDRELANARDGLLPIALGPGLAFVLLAFGGQSIAAATALGTLVAALPNEGPFAAVLVFTAGRLAEAYVAAALVRRMRADQRGLRRVPDVLLLVGVAAGASLIGASTEAITSSIRGGAPASLDTIFRGEWLAHATGMLVIAPLALALRDPVHRDLLRRRSPVELVLASSLVAAVALAGMTDWFGRPSLVYPTLLWLTLRFGLGGGAIASAIVAIVAAAAVHQGVGPLVQGTWPLTCLHTQVIIAAVTMMDLVLGVTTAERAVTHEALSNAFEYQRALIESSPAPIVVLDLAGNVAAWNPAAERLFGWSSVEVLGKPPPTIPPGREREIDSLRASALLGEPRVVTTDRLRRDGSAVEVRVTAGVVRDGSGRPVGTLSIFEDTTARRQAEAARERLATIVENTSDFVGVAAPSGAMIYVNRAGRKLAGIGEDEDVSTLRFVDFHPDYELGRIAHEVMPAAARDGVWSGELAFRGVRTGETIPALQVVMAHRNESRELDFYAMIVRDNRERLEAEAALRATEAQLRQAQKMEAVGQLAGGVAHDFNNLLTIMLGFSDVVLAKLGPDHPQRREVGEIRAAGQRAAALTRQLLAFSRQQVVEPRVLQLNTLVEGLDAMLSRLLGATVTVEKHLDPALGCVSADPSQLEQVLMNLVVNARDAMPGGGRLTITTSNVDVSAAEARTFLDSEGPPPGPYVLLRVSDTGVGMTAATRARIFEPFFTTKGAGKGTGLGLATVYGIVKQSSGHVLARSTPSAGTTFDVYLPRVSGEGSALVEVAEERASAGGHETILLAEDEPVVRELAQRVLVEQGYRVLSAQDGEAALEIALHFPERIDLLVTDVIMPKTTGPELARELRTIRQGIRLLFISGYADRVLMSEDVFASGAAFLQKPFSPRALARRVREVLDAPGMADAAGTAFG